MDLDTHDNASCDTGLDVDDSLCVNSTSSHLTQLNKENYERDKEACFRMFNSWSGENQMNFIENVLSGLSNAQHGHINTLLKPMLQRDFISIFSETGLELITEHILLYLDAKSLRVAELVCTRWNQSIADCKLWKKMIGWKVTNDQLWNDLGKHREWISTVTEASRSSQLTHSFYRRLYSDILRDIEKLDENWKWGNYNLLKIYCNSEDIKGVYCLQYDDEKIVSGLRDNSIKVWDRKTLKTTEMLQGHTGSVLCLQYDGTVLATGSSDATVRIWDLTTGEVLNTLIHHDEAVLHLRFQDDLMITCSKDRSIAVWDFYTPSEIVLRQVLVGHRAAVNVVDFDDKYIISASGDRTIKVWSTTTCEFIKTLTGHRRGIACLQYNSPLVATGSSDYTIRLWDIECGFCIRVLEGHEDLVRCIRFDAKHIVSGAYDGTIKVWDLPSALDPRKSHNTLCKQTLIEHTGRVFRVQFDDFQIVSSSHDDSIVVWDFLGEPDENAVFRPTKQYPFRKTSSNIISEETNT